MSRVIAFAAFIWALAVMLFASGCTFSVPPRAEAASTAIARFSREDYCPLARTSAVLAIPRPAPPPPIARDPERLAMWGEAARRAADDEARKTVVVSGCGDTVTFACWEFPGSVPRTSRSRRARVPRSIGWSCNEIPGSAQPAVLSVHP